uniref:Uncharacterized protein n=1 Tax=Oryza punctata TaxID=4537 RepID=A0A0E0LZ90_ORYPU
MALVAVREEDVPAMRICGNCSMVRCGSGDGCIGDLRVWAGWLWGIGAVEPQASGGCSVGGALGWSELVQVWVLKVTMTTSSRGMTPPWGVAGLPPSHSLTGFSK